MQLFQVKPLAELAPGSVAELDTGDTLYAVCNVDGQILCVDGTCPHAGGPLGQGTLHGATLVCPWHGWEFDTHTGRCEVGEDVPLKTYPVVVQNGQVFVELP